MIVLYAGAVRPSVLRCRIMAPYVPLRAEGNIINYVARACLQQNYHLPAYK